jgi:hypothetical protein
MSEWANAPSNSSPAFKIQFTDGLAKIVANRTMAPGDWLVGLPKQNEWLSGDWVKVKVWLLNGTPSSPVARGGGEGGLHSLP